MAYDFIQRVINRKIMDWIKMSEKIPNKTGVYMTYTARNHRGSSNYRVLYFNEHHKYFFCALLDKDVVDVLYWAELTTPTL